MFTGEKLVKSRNSPIMHHELLNRKKSLVSDVRVLVSEKLHHTLLAAELFDYTKTRYAILIDRNKSKRFFLRIQRPTYCLPRG